MANTTFSGPIRTKNGLKHLTVTPVTGAETEIEIVDSSGKIGSTANALATGAGTGITTGTGTVYVSTVVQLGGITKTTILIDLAGLTSAAAADIIGVNDAANCHLGQILTAESGTIFAGVMTCMEAPTTGEPDIDLYSAVESTGTENDPISGLDETALMTAADDHVINVSDPLTAFPADEEYLYLVASGGGTAGNYDAGKFLIELWGYTA